MLTLQRPVESMLNKAVFVCLLDAETCEGDEESEGHRKEEGD